MFEGAQNTCCFACGSRGGQDRLSAKTEAGSDEVTRDKGTFMYVPWARTGRRTEEIAEHIEVV